MSNVSDLQDYLLSKAPGTKLNIATSQYADNTTAPGFTFDYRSTAQAVQAVAGMGYCRAEYFWRYFEVTVL